MTERDALYAAVLAEPEADAPRLVYADWLEEHPRGEADTARAHFIRLEVEAETLPPDSPERGALEAAAAKLFNRHGEVWNQELPTWAEWYNSTLVYRRGFPHELRIVFRKLRYGGNQLLASAPIRSLQVNTAVGYLSLNNTPPPDLGGITSLWVGPGLDFRADQPQFAREVFFLIALYPTLVNLRRLSLAGNNLVDDLMIPLDLALRQAVFLPNFEELDLSDNAIQAAGLAALSSVPSLRSIKRLVVTGNRLTAESRRMLRGQFGGRVILD